MDDTVSALALRESEELHRITLINMSDAVFITDDEGVFTFICPNVDVIFGATVWTRFGPWKKFHDFWERSCSSRDN